MNINLRKCSGEYCNTGFWPIKELRSGYTCHTARRAVVLRRNFEQNTALPYAAKDFLFLFYVVMCSKVKPRSKKRVGSTWSRGNQGVVLSAPSLWAEVKYLHCGVGAGASPPSHSAPTLLNYSQHPQGGRAFSLILALQRLM